MKKIIPILFAIILTLLIFTGCGYVPEGVDAFEPGDTVIVSVGETYYRSSSQWFKLDSVIEDTRMPDGYPDAGSGRVRLVFSLADHSLHDDSPVILSSDSDMYFVLNTFHFPSIDHVTDYKYTVIDVSPYAMAELECEQEDYRVTMVCQWYNPELEE